MAANPSPPAVVACPDKFRGTATAAEVAAAISEAVDDVANNPASGQASQQTKQLPLADGGEGTLEALGGANRSTVIRGPLGEPVEAHWRLDLADHSTPTAVIEMAQASGLQLAGGARGNDPMAATTYGTGELIAAAVRAGARRIIVALGGSATTDGGLGAAQALEDAGLLGRGAVSPSPASPSPASPRATASTAPGPTVSSTSGGVGALAATELLAACDVLTKFTDAPKVFGPQKGATPRQIVELEQRLRHLVNVYRDKFGFDVAELERAGAAGGLGGGLAACGAKLVSGFDLVAQEVGLEQAIAAASLVVTGEGKLDAGSFDGKVVGEVAALAQKHSVPLLIVVGISDDTGLTAARYSHPEVTVISLAERFGRRAALGQTLECVRQAVREFLVAD